MRITKVSDWIFNEMEKSVENNNEDNWINENNLFSQLQLHFPLDSNYNRKWWLNCFLIISFIHLVFHSLSFSLFLHDRLKIMNNKYIILSSLSIIDIFLFHSICNSIVPLKFMNSHHGKWTFSPKGYKRFCSRSMRCVSQSRDSNVAQPNKKEKNITCCRSLINHSQSNNLFDYFDSWFRFSYIQTNVQ